MINDRSFSSLLAVPHAWVHMAAEAYPLDGVAETLLPIVCAAVTQLMGTMGWAASIHAEWSEHASVAQVRL